MTITETGAETTSQRATVVVYSHRPQFVSTVELAIGTRPVPAVEIRYEVFATHPDLQRRLDLTHELGPVDLCILDGEASPTGGLGISRQFKNERSDCPAMLVVVARKDDTFLAGWSQADAVLHQPIDPAEIAAAVVDLVSRRRADPPAARKRGLLMRLGLAR